MSRLESPELQRVVHDCVPRMIIATGLPRSLARAIGERGCSTLAMRERLTFVHEEAERLALDHRTHERANEAERAELLATITSVLAMHYQMRGHDSAADALLQEAIELCVRWTMTEVASRPAAKSSRLHDGWSSLRARLASGRRKPATVS